MIKNSSSQDSGHSESPSKPIPSNLQSLREALADQLETTLGQNYVDEYSGSDKSMSVYDIADSLLSVVTQHAINERLDEATYIKEQLVGDSLSEEMISNRLLALKAQQEEKT